MESKVIAAWTRGKCVISSLLCPNTSEYFSILMDEQTEAEGDGWGG